MQDTGWTGLLIVAIAWLRPGALPAHASGDIHVDEAVEHYPIRGEDEGDWQAAMRAGGPRDPVTGRRFSGSTRWSVSWNWDTYPLADGMCQRGAHQVRLDVRIRLPEWVDRAAADDARRRQWDAVHARLRDHEAVHRANALAAASAVDAMFKQARDAEPCRGMRQRLDRRVRRTLDLFHQRDRHFDRQTRHGRVDP